MNANDFFKIDFLDGALECCIAAPESTLLFEDIIEIRLNFNGKENKLWQLKSYLVGNARPATYSIKDDIYSENSKDAIQIAKLFNLKGWAKNRNIPCAVVIRGWGIKSIFFRILKFFYDYLQKNDSFDGNTPAI